MGTLVKLTIDENFPVDKALKKFKRLCDTYGVVREYKNRSEYKKPSVKAKEKQKAAAKRLRKVQIKSTRRSTKI